MFALRFDGGGLDAMSTSNYEELELSADDLLVPGSQDWLRFGPAKGFPRFFVDAKGPYVWDTAGHKYLDLYNGSGAIILGHGHEQQVRYVIDHISHGASVSFRHPEEIRLAETLRGLLPFVDRFLFLKTGSECVHLALRTALLATGRSKVISFGYHGWITPYDNSGIPLPNCGVLDGRWDLRASVETIRSTGNDLAAVIIGPSPFAPEPEFYKILSVETRNVGAVLIMDEIKSGFRWAYPCLSAVLDLRPDLLCLSKALGNGFPLAVCAGTERLLGRRDFVSFFSTFACENVGIFAGVACLEELAAGAYARFQAASTSLHGTLQAALGGAGIRVVGVPTFFRLEFPEHVRKPELAAKMLERGILFHPKDEVILSAAHQDKAVLEFAAAQLVDVLVKSTFLDAGLQRDN